MCPAVAVSAVPALVALEGGVANLVTGAATYSGLLVVGTIGMNMAYIPVHEAEVVYVNNWWDSRACRGILQLGGVRGEGEEDSGSGGRGVDCGCIEEVCAN